MSQEQFAQRGIHDKAFGQKSENTFWISLGVSIVLIGALGIAASNASAGKAVAKSAVSVQAKAKSVDPVYRCADGRVSFAPCS